MQTKSGHIAVLPKHQPPLLYTRWNDYNDFVKWTLVKDYGGIENLSLGNTFTDTLVTGAKLNPDLVFKNNSIHLVYNDNGSNSIKYVRGSFNNTSYIYEHQNKQEIFYNFDLLGRKTKKPSFILNR